MDGKQVPETVDVIWVKQKAKSEAIISDASVTVPPMEFDTLEDFLKPGRELFDKEMKQIDERLAKVVEGSAEHSLLTTKKKQLQQQWDLSVAQVKGMAAAAKAGKPVQLAPIVIPNNSRPWQAPMPDPLLGHDEDIAEVLAGTWQVKRYVTGRRRSSARRRNSYLQQKHDDHALQAGRRGRGYTAGISHRQRQDRYLAQGLWARYANSSPVSGVLFPRK